MNDPSTHTGWKRISFLTVFLCVLVCGLYYQFFFNKAHVFLDIEVQQKTLFKLYWSGPDQNFSEQRRALLRVIPGQNTYRFVLTDLSDVSRLRLDPLQYGGEAIIRELTLRQAGFEDYSVDFSRVEPLHDIAAFEFRGGGLYLMASGGDPNFLIIPQFTDKPVDWVTELLRYAFICLTIIFVMQACWPLQDDFSYVPIMLSMALVQIVLMAAVSKYDVHPDERVHIAATRYYQDHWLPPEIDAPEIENTYSPYGVSRLNNGELYYLLAGKFSKMAAGFNIPSLLSLRLFNSFLFACILIYAIGSVPARLVALPFLITPQVWYIFSYCGSDAFGLFLCFLAGCEIARPNSHLNRLFTVDRLTQKWQSIIFVSLLLAMMLLLKINYYPFIALLGFYVFWKLVFETDRQRRRGALSLIAIVCLLALAGAGLRMGADYYVNGLDRQEQLLAMREKLALPSFKPSTEPGEKFYTMNLKQRGTTLVSLITKNKWFGHSFVSGFGHYGYFTIASPEWYYGLMKWAAGVFMAFILGTILLRGNAQSRVFVLMVLMFSLALIGASLHRSWTVDFQAQGRYLFPILPMVGVVLAGSRRLFANGYFTTQVVFLYGLALYSFIFVALVYIPRTI